jgi:hypothetical protein
VALVLVNIAVEGFRKILGKIFVFMFNFRDVTIFAEGESFCFTAK